MPVQGKCQKADEDGTTSVPTFLQVKSHLVLAQEILFFCMPITSCQEHANPKRLYFLRHNHPFSKFTAEMS